MASNDPRFEPLTTYRAYPPDEMRARAAAFAEDLHRRRTVRQFSSRPVAREVIESCVLAAGSAPSGANMQPWHFAVVSDPETKRRIREAAEVEERQFYTGRAPQAWLDALAPLGTDSDKPFLEAAPYLIVIFGQLYHLGPDGQKIKHYYVQESVGIATGLLVAAVHNAGLVSLTHTPSPMGFLAAVLDRPPNERAFLILVVGHPDDSAQVPAIERKPLSDYVSFIDGQTASPSDAADADTPPASSPASPPPPTAAS